MRGASFRFDHGDEKSTNNIPSNRWWCYQIFAVLNLCLLIFFPAKNRCINWWFLRNILTGYIQSIFENNSTGETKLVNQFQFSCFDFFWFIDIVFRFSIWCNDYKIGIFAKYFGCFVQQCYRETLGKFHNWSLTTSKCTSIFQIHFWNSPSQDCEFQTCKALNPSGREPKLVPTVPWSISASASSLAKSS